MDLGYILLRFEQHKAQVRADRERDRELHKARRRAFQRRLKATTEEEKESP